MNEQVTHYSNGIESPLKCFKIKIRFIVMHIYIHTRNLSSAFNQSRLAPVEHARAHAQGHTLKEMPYTLEQWAANHSPRGAWGYGALLKGTSADTPPTVSSPII